MPKPKWFVPRLRDNGLLLIHFLLLALSALFLAGAFYLNGNLHSGSYAVKFAFKNVDTFISHNFQTLVVFLLVVPAMMIFFVSTLRLKIVMTVMLCISLGSIVLGTMLGGLAGFFPVQSIYLEEQSYHLSHFYDGSDTAYYELFGCDSSGISCQRIQQYGSPYTSFRAQAKLELDEASKRILVIVDDNTVDSISIR